MGISLHVIESSPASAESIMATDAFLLSTLTPDGPVILHLYEWNGPCLTYGHFTDPAKYLHPYAALELGLQMARRPTGGGIIFHLTDLAFSILIPANHPGFSLNTLENYAFINERISNVVSEFSSGRQTPVLYKQDSGSLSVERYPFCMAKPTRYDLLINGKKIGGAAQRRTKQGLLHQGSLSLVPTPESVLKTVLKEKLQVMHAISDQAGYLLEDNDQYRLDQARLTLRDLIKKMVSNNFF